MPAVTVSDITILPRVIADSTLIVRPVVSVTTAPQGYEGEGFPVRRAFAGIDIAALDPFIHLDQMGEVEYAPGEPKGTPWHPHRGFETVTYIIDGIFDHRDSNGGGGTITNGDTQWMTAGAGILHIETPPEHLVMSGGLFHGFQLWVNLPARLKMTKPRYQEIKADKIPVFEKDGVKIKVIAGQVGEVKGAVAEIYAEPNYLDFTMLPNATFTHSISDGHNAFAYIFEGSADFDETSERIENPKLIVFTDGDFVKITAGQEGARFLLVSGKPLAEPVSRYGPFVMNTRAEIHQAIQDLQNGTFNWTEEKARANVFGEI